MTNDQFKDELNVMIEPNATIAVANGFENIDNFNDYVERVRVPLQLFPSGFTFCLGSISQVKGPYAQVREELVADLTKRRLGGFDYLIIAIPEILCDSNGCKYFIGNIPRENYDSQFPFNRFLNELGRLPEEFIAGILHQSEDGTMEFEPNGNYITNKEEAAQVAFVDSILPGLTKNGIMRVDDLGQNVQIFGQDSYYEQLNKYLRRNSFRRE